MPFCIATYCTFTLHNMVNWPQYNEGIFMSISLTAISLEEPSTVIYNLRSKFRKKIPTTPLGCYLCYLCICTVSVVCLWSVCSYFLNDFVSKWQHRLEPGSCPTNKEAVHSSWSRKLVCYCLQNSGICFQKVVKEQLCAAGVTASYLLW